MAFQPRVVEFGEFGGEERGVIHTGIGSEGGGELADQVPQSRAVQGEQPAGQEEEAERVAEGFALERDGVLVDVPVPVRTAPGPEGQRQVVIQRERVAAAGPCHRLDDLFVGEGAEHLGEKTASRTVPVLGVQLGGGEQRRFCFGVEASRRIQHGDSSGWNRFGTGGVSKATVRQGGDVQHGA